MPAGGFIAARGAENNSGRGGGNVDATFVFGFSGASGAGPGRSPCE
jgi:hypothetical protein